MFAGLWATFVYFPVAHWVFAFDGITATHGGWIANQLKALDFAGGTAILPQISGRAVITGFHRFVSNPEDPLDQGFQLRSGNPPCLCNMERKPVRREETP